MTREAFVRDLYRGREIEVNIVSALKDKFPATTLIDGKFKDYDAFIPEISKKLEIKMDEVSLRTGRIVIELEMFGKPSGLLSTKADDWVIYTGKQYLWIKPSKIFECILLNGLKTSTIVGNGDSNPKTICFIQNDLFKKYCHTIQDVLNIEEVYNNIGDRR